MNTVEDRVREALRARAEDFTASPDAWQRIRAQSRAGAARRRRGLSRMGRSVIPAGAAAAVVVIAVVAAILAGGVSGRSGKVPAGAARTGPSATSSARATGPSDSVLPPYLLREDPPKTPITRLPVPPTPTKTVAYFWVGDPSPAYWVDEIPAGPQLCQFLYDGVLGAGGGFCEAQPSRAHVVTVTASAGPWEINGEEFVMGVAAAQVKSVTAVLPDGHTYAGAVGGGRGLPYRTWAVSYRSGTGGVRLVFRDAAGRQVANVSAAAAPQKPTQIRQPRSGGVTVYRYAGVPGIPAGTVTGYLIDGRVAFGSPLFVEDEAEICPVPAGGQPVVDGVMTDTVTSGQTGATMGVVALGYAHAGVARVVVRVPDGKLLSVSTFAAGWRGSDLRLWAVKLPKDSFNVAKGSSMAVTATAYDAAGQVIGTVQLGVLGD
jgi:hypothetical protein